jgi:hypothetical protein
MKISEELARSPYGTGNWTKLGRFSFKYFPPAEKTVYLTAQETRKNNRSSNGFEAKNILRDFFFHKKLFFSTEVGAGEVG